MKYILALTLIIGGYLCTLGGIPPNELQKIFYHDGMNVKEKNNYLELGKIVFYFEKDPIILTDSSNPNHTEYVFFFPKVIIKNTECKKALIASNANKLESPQKPYSIKLEIAEKVIEGKSIKGVKMSLAYDPQLVMHAIESFDAINMSKGVVVRLYNKKLIEAIKNKGNGILQLAHADKKKEIIIDCGHGGADFGTHGHFNLEEKNITLDVGLHVAKILRNKGYKVVLTRETDIDLPLDVRTSLANKYQSAQLFISIHANNARSDLASGIETFCLQPHLFKMMQNNHRNMYAEQGTTFLYNQSKLLAQAVQNSTIQAAQSKQKDVINRKVKHSVAQVLLGTNMPSALVEIGFLSNKQEANLLNDQEYRKHIAQGICDGIERYTQKSAA